MGKSEATSDFWEGFSDITIVSVRSTLLQRGLRMGTKFRNRLDVSTLVFPFLSYFVYDGSHALTYATIVCLIRFLSAFNLPYHVLVALFFHCCRCQQ